MEDLLHTAGGTVAAIAAFMVALGGVFFSPPGKWLWHRNVRLPVQEFLRREIESAIAPFGNNLKETTGAFEGHMIEEGKRLAVEAEKDLEAEHWRHKVDAQLEDGTIRFERIEAKIDALGSHA